MRMRTIIAALLVLLPALAFADTKTIEGTTNVEDAQIDDGGNANRNYGGRTNMSTYTQNNISFFIRAKNVASELGPGATITACTLFIYCLYSGDEDSVRAYRVFKPWVEGTQNGGTAEPGVTYNDWDNDDWEWSVAGCQCANDGGYDNSVDDGICGFNNVDRKATAEDSVYVTTTGVIYKWNISIALAQGWYDGTINEEGVILRGQTTPGENTFNSTEAASNQPYWVFTYTTEEPEAAGQVIMIQQ